jgi:hypothetical protein
MDSSISNNPNDETIEAKTLWFRSLSLEERMEMFCVFTEFLLLTNPKIVERKNAEPIEGSVCVLSAA